MISRKEKLVKIQTDKHTNKNSILKSMYNFATLTVQSVMLNEAKTSRPRPRPRPELRGRGQGRGQNYEVEAEARNNYEKVPNND